MSLEPPPPPPPPPPSPPVAAATCWTKAMYARIPVWIGGAADGRVVMGGRVRRLHCGVRWLLMQSPPLKYYSAAFSHTHTDTQTNAHTQPSSCVRVYMYSVLTVVARRRVTLLLSHTRARTYTPLSLAQPVLSKVRRWWRRRLRRRWRWGLRGDCTELENNTEAEQAHTGRVEKE